MVHLFLSNFIPLKEYNFIRFKIYFDVKLALTMVSNETCRTSFCAFYTVCAVKWSFYCVTNFSDKFMYSPPSYLKTHYLCNSNELCHQCICCDGGKKKSKEILYTHILSADVSHQSWDSLLHLCKKSHLTCLPQSVHMLIHQ